MTKKEIEQLQEKLETAKQSKAQAQGALASLETNLREKYGLEEGNELDQADELLSKLEKDRARLEKELGEKEEALEAVIPEEWK